MKTKHCIFSLIMVIFITTTQNLNASTFFSGYAGGKLNFGANPESVQYDPDLKLQAFFAGQFNFTKNMWAHVEVSINTQDLISESIFHETPSIFQIDELSWILRSNLNNSSNYLGLFMGTYDPVGSDVFLQRYFGIDPISSKITDSYLGLAGSILYPHFGFGISDVLKFYDSPFAIGAYIYVNHEDANYFVLNTDLRFACVLRYFICDFACGLGTPLSDKYKNQDIIVAIDKLYWHMGATMLVGNKYTPASLFIQAGLYNASFTGKPGSFNLSPEDLYILFEPRFGSKNFHFNLSLYSLPKNTIKKLLFVDDSIGANANLYNDNLMIGSHKFTLGSHFSFSIKNKTLMDIGKEDFLSDGFNIALTPYISTDFLSGEVHIQSCIRVTEFSKGFGNAFSIDLGYRTKF